MSLRELFLKGRYKEIVDDFDRKSGKLSKAQTSWVAASLALLGRSDDALQLGRADDPVARFYIAISLIRSAPGEKASQALSDFIQNSERDDETQRFFVFQSLGFRAFIEGRFNKSLYWSNRAWGLALRIGGLHEKILSADLRGHSLIQIGRIDEGLASLETALEIARRFGNVAHVGALQASIAIAEVEHGFRSDVSLLEMLEGAASQDSYTSANLLGELARQANLRGRYREALKYVAQTRPLVKVVRNKRQTGFLAVREAYSYFRLGNYDRALEIIDAVEMKLERRDRAVLIELKGLRFQILMTKADGSSSKSGGGPTRRLERRMASLQNEIRELAFEVKSRRSLSFLKRWTSEKLILPGQPTPIERWIHGATDLHVRLELVERGYLSFFENQIDSSDENVILLSLVPGKVLFRSKRQLSVENDRFSSVLRRGLLILAKNRCSKADLLQLVWGYEYESYRHDTLIYTFISRLRIALGPNRSLLTHSKEDDSYGFSEPVRVKVLEFDVDRARGDGAQKFDSVIENDLEPSPTHLDLNLRQLDVLARLNEAYRYARSDETLGLAGPHLISPHLVSVSPGDLIERFNVSRVTATRDLSELSKIKRLVRTGSGRGTRYVLREAWESKALRGV